jgi:serine/threonine protein kinase
MATSNTAADRARRLSGLVDAAVLLPAPARAPWLDRACAGDAAMRLEAETLLAHHAELAALDPDRRERLNELFHAALGLPPDHRGQYLDLACAGDVELRRDVESLIAHASDTDFLEQSPLPPTEGETTLARLHIREEVQYSTSAQPVAGAPVGGGAMDALVGRQLGVYQVRRWIGGGGFCWVYLALDTVLHRPVALKVLQPEYSRSPEWRQRFVGEARTAALLSHPNVATVYTVHPEGDELFIVEEYVDGPTLRGLISIGPVEYQRLVRLFVEVARGLAAAHELGIVHRDLKPENIMLTSEDVPKIVDFGLAKSTKAIIQSSTRLDTAPGTRPGTPAYMAPEQLDDARAMPVDFRADLFAFGVTLYEAATGVHPFAGRSLPQTFDNIRRLQPVPLKRSGADMSELDAIVRRCLEKEPSKRYASTRDLVSELEQLGVGSRPVVPVSVARPAAATPRRSTVWWELHQLATSAFVCGSLIYLWLVQGLVQPAWAGRALAFLGLVPGAVAVGFRLHLWFSARQRLKTLHETRRHHRLGLRAADVMLTAVFFLMSALLLAVDRPGTAAPFLILAIVNPMLFLAIEPASERDAFEDEAGRG